jgi:hypothetical protein
MKTLVILFALSFLVACLFFQPAGFAGFVVATGMAAGVTFLFGPLPGGSGREEEASASGEIFAGPSSS